MDHWFFLLKNIYLRGCLSRLRVFNILGTPAVYTLYHNNRFCCTQHSLRHSVLVYWYGSVELVTWWYAVLGYHSRVIVIDVALVLGHPDIL